MAVIPPVIPGCQFVFENQFDNSPKAELSWDENSSLQFAIFPKASIGHFERRGVHGRDIVFLVVSNIDFYTLFCLKAGSVWLWNQSMEISLDHFSFLPHLFSEKFLVPPYFGHSQAVITLGRLPCFNEFFYLFHLFYNS